MLKAVPDLGDIYGVATHALIGGDAHDAARRCGVVELGPDYVKTLPRSTTEKHVEGVTLRSGIDLSCKLDRLGVFTTRFKHSLRYGDFEKPRICDFYGPLGDGARRELLAFWDKTLYP